MCTLLLIYYPQSSSLAPRLHASAINSNHLDDLLIITVAIVGRSRVGITIGASRNGNGSRSADRGTATGSVSIGGVNIGGVNIEGISIEGVSIGADVLAQKVLACNRKNAALGLLASGSAAADEVVSAVGSGSS
jgi:hypothetical protein